MRVLLADSAAGALFPMIILIKLDGIAMPVLGTDDGAAGGLGGLRGLGLLLGDDVGLVGGDGSAVDGQAGGLFRNDDLRAGRRIDDLHILGHHDDQRAVRSVHKGAGFLGIMAHKAIDHGDDLRTGDLAERVQQAIGVALDNAGLDQRGHIGTSIVADQAQIRKTGQRAHIFGCNAQRTAQHDHGLLPGDGILRHGLALRALQDACGGAAVDAVGIPGVGGHIGKPGRGRGGQVQQTAQNHGHLSAGQRAVGRKLALAALEHAVVAPAKDRALGPVSGHIAVSGFFCPGGHRQKAEHHHKCQQSS